MRVLGVDFNLGIGSKDGSMAICTIDNIDGENKVIDMHVGETGLDVDKACDTLISLMKINNCDYIAINPSGVFRPMVDKLKEQLGEKVKDEFMSMRDIHEMIIMLQNDNVLKRVGLELKTECRNGGFLTFHMGGYSDFEIAMVYSIALANRVLNKEVLNRKRKAILEELDYAKKVVSELSSKLEQLELKNK